MTAAFSPRVTTLDERYQRQDGTDLPHRHPGARPHAARPRPLRPASAARATACYVSGYEGSPLGGFDLELARQRALLDEYGIVHQPGLNEELAATSVSGSQLAGQVGDAQQRRRHRHLVRQGARPRPGDRRAAARQHGRHRTGTGGAVALVGDDPAAKSSTLPCSSEMALAGLTMPTFYPADAAEVLVTASTRSSCPGPAACGPR